MAEDINVIVNRVKKALEVIHAYNTPQNQRHEAYQFLEKMQKQEAIRLKVAYSLMDKNEESEYRHYGLSLLERELLHLDDRNAQNHAQRASELIQVAENLLHNGIKPFAQEKPYVKKKIIKLVDCLAQRFWPVNWTNLKTLLFQTESPEQVEMNLLCLESLHMTTADFKLGLTQARGKEMNEALVSFQNDTLELLNNVLASQKDCPPLMKAAIACTASFVRVASLETILRTNLLVTVVELVPETSYFQICVDALRAFLRRTAKHLKPPLGNTIREMWKKLHLVTALIMKNPNLSRDDYLNPLLDLLVQLVMKHSGVLTKGGKALRQELLEILMKGCDETNPATVHLIISLWHDLLSRTQVNKPGMVESLFKICFRKLDQNWVDREYFDDKKQLNTFNNKLRGIIDKLIKCLFLRDPKTCLRQTYQTIVQVMATKETDPAKVDSLGWVKYESSVQWQWNALKSLMGILFLQKDPAPVDLKNQENLQMVKGIMDKILEYDTRDSLILTRWYHILSLPLPFYACQPEYVLGICKKILQDLQKTVEFQSNLPDFETIHTNFVACRRRGCYTLLKLAKDCGTIVLNYWEDVFAECQKIMSSKVHDSVQGHILEFLVATSNACDDPQQRFQFLGLSLESPIKFWCHGEEVKTVCENPLAFAQLFQVTDDGRIAGKEFLDKLRTTLNIFNGVLGAFKLHDSMSEPFWQLFQPILQQTLLFIRCLNSLWTEEFKAELGEKLVPILENNLALMYTHYGVEFDMTQSIMKRPKKFRPAEKLFNWIYCVYEQTSILLGLASRFGPKICDKYNPQTFIDHCFFNADHIPLHHFRWLCSKFFTQFGRTCPTSHYKTLFMPIFIKTLAISFTKLDKGWNSYNAAMRNSNHLSEVQIKREILQETQLRESSKKFAESLGDLMISPADKGSTTKRDFRKKKTNPRTNPSRQDILTSLVIQDQYAADVTFHGLCATFTWKDSLVHKRICYLGRKIALLAVDKETNVVNVPAVLPHLSKLMFAALLACMNMDGRDTPTESAVSDLIQSVCTSVGRHSEVPLQILQNVPDVQANDLEHLIEILIHGNDKRCRTSTRKFIEAYVVGKNNPDFRHSSFKTMQALGGSGIMATSPTAAKHDEPTEDFTLSGFQQIFGASV